MIEFLKNLGSVTNIAILIAVVALIRVFGEGLIAIGKAKEGEDAFDIWGIKVMKVVTFIGKIFTYLGIGNHEEK
jgi:hypothetical protein